MPIGHSLGSQRGNSDRVEGPKMKLYFAFIFGPTTLMRTRMPLDIKGRQVSDSRFPASASRFGSKMSASSNVMSQFQGLRARLYKTQVWMPRNRNPSHPAIDATVPNEGLASLCGDSEGESAKLAIANENLPCFGRFGRVNPAL
jgi:hypothetical protein